METLIHQFKQALESLDRTRAELLFQQALESRAPIETVEQFIVPALEQLGQSWEDGDVALSQIYMGGRYCEELVDRVLPPSDPARKHQPRQAIVVLNDFHMLGKRIVYSVMRASGYDIFDYGHMDVDGLVERVISEKIGILLISVLMMPSALKIRQVRDALDSRNAQVKILVGGAPFLFDPELWKEVGADAMGHNAGEAVDIVRRWAEEMA